MSRKPPRTPRTLSSPEHQPHEGPVIAAGPSRVRGARGGDQVMRAVARAVRQSLWDPAPRDHRDSARALRRRQVVTCVTLVVGAVVLGLSLRIDPGSDRFYPA